MPTYARKCLKKKCKHTFEHFCTVAEKEAGIKCEKCGGETETVWVTTGRSGGAGFPYVSTNIDGKGTPIVIENISHLRKLEKKFGVVVRGFSDYSESTAQDPLKDLPIHRPGGEDYRGQLAPNLRPKQKKWWEE